MTWCRRKLRVLRNALLLVGCCIVGLLTGQFITDYWPSLKAQFFSADSLYQSDAPLWDETFETKAIQPIGWQTLLPDAEKNVLNAYQNTPDASFSEQLFRSLQASSDKAYQSALQSTKIVDELIGEAVSISGFVVPIDVRDDRTIKHFFLVPYYGACIHFPPPPPNQMIFVRLGEGFSLDSIETPVTITGRLQQGLFEDPLGTSAYMMQVSRIDAFYGQPDDFRRHKDKG